MISTLTGSNHFLLQQEHNRLVNEFTTKYGDIGLEKLDGEEVETERLVEAIQSLPFLAERKLVVLRSPGAQKTFGEQIEALIKTVPDEIDVLIVEPKIDKRSAYFKVLKSQTEYKEFAESDSQNLNTWIVQQAKNQGGAITQSDARYLLERVGTNQQLLYHEMEKLLAYSPTINRQSIDLLTDPTPQSTIFELLDSAFAGNNQRTLELYQQQRSLKVEPQQIMAMLAWQLHVLTIVKTAGNKSPEEIAKQARVNPFVVSKTANIARQTSLTEVKDLVKRALDLDVRLKSQAINPDDAIQHFLLTIR